MCVEPTTPFTGEVPQRRGAFSSGDSIIGYIESWDCHGHDDLMVTSCHCMQCLSLG